MNTETKLIKNKLGLLKLAEELGNVLSEIRNTVKMEISVQ